MKFIHWLIVGIIALGIGAVMSTISFFMTGDVQLRCAIAGLSMHLEGCFVMGIAYIVHLLKR